MGLREQPDILCEFSSSTLGADGQQASGPLATQSGPSLHRCSEAGRSLDRFPRVRMCCLSFRIKETFFISITCICIGKYNCESVHLFV